MCVKPVNGFFSPNFKVLNEPRYLGNPIRTITRYWAPRLSTARTFAAMVVIFGTSTSDFAGDAIRLQHFGHGEAAEEERKRPEHSRLSPTKSRLFAKLHLKERESPNEWRLSISCSGEGFILRKLPSQSRRNHADGSRGKS